MKKTEKMYMSRKVDYYNLYNLTNEMMKKKEKNYRIENKKENKYRIEKESEKKIYKPRTKNQEIYVDYLKNPDNSIVVGLGPAGSGKTLFACSLAIAELKSGNIQKLVLTRPIVSVDEELGFLPGSLVEKMNPWTRPIFDIFLDFFKKNEIDSMIRDEIIEICPLAYMRGRTFKNTWIIADEMQNSSPNQMLMLTTRIGENARMTITGDLEQSDRSGENGLLDLIQKINNYNKENMISNIKVIKMTTDDIQRSEIVSQVLKIYNPYVAPTQVVAPLVNQTEEMKPIKKNEGFDDAAMIPLRHYKK
jgi:phosphate starvation-inducible PhoH-like protein